MGSPASLGTLLSDMSYQMNERRLGYRIPFESMVTSYVHDRPIRALASNISDSGINMSSISMLAPPPGLVVGLELDLPGTSESIWAAGQICYRTDDPNRRRRASA